MLPPCSRRKPGCLGGRALRTPERKGASFPVLFVGEIGRSAGHESAALAFRWLLVTPLPKRLFHELITCYGLRYFLLARTYKLNRTEPSCDGRGVVCPLRSLCYVPIAIIVAKRNELQLKVFDPRQSRFT